LSLDWDGNGNPVIAEALECAVTLFIEEYEARLRNGRLILDVHSTTYGSFEGSEYNRSWVAFANGTTFLVNDGDLDIFSLARSIYSALIGNSTGEGQ